MMPESIATAASRSSFDGELSSLVSERLGLLCSARALVGFLDGRPQDLARLSEHEYTRRLEAEPAHPEWARLFRDLTIPETYFFRNRPQWQAFQTFVVPGALERAALESRPLRLWSAGCSTGEEPYTAAIALRDLLGRNPSVRIVATDLVTERLEYARVGRYRRNSFRGMAPGEIERSFHSEGDVFVLAPEIRELVSFESLNLADQRSVDAFLERQAPFDIIFCRNVLIYLEPTLISWLLGRFADSVGEGTVLLGHAEFARQWTDRLQPHQVGESFVWLAPTSRGAALRKRAESTARARTPQPAPRRKQRLRKAPRVRTQSLPSVASASESLAQAGALMERIRRGPANAALDEVRDWAETHELLPEAHFVLAVALENTGDVDRARAAYARARYLDGSFSLARWRLAMLMAQTERLDRAAGEARAAARAVAGDSSERLAQLSDLAGDELARTMEDTVAWIESLRTEQAG